MCGRFSLEGSAATLASHFNVQESLAWTPRYNIAPTQEVLTVVQPPGSAREVRRMRWGLIPAWAKEPGIGNQLINARAETVATKPAFRVLLRDRRCLIRRFHHRMPVILSPADYDLWLGVERHDVDRILPLLKPYPSEAMTAHPVSSLVNSPSNDSRACQFPAG